MAYIRIACNLPSGKCVLYDYELIVTVFFFGKFRWFFVTNDVPESVHYVPAHSRCYNSF
jgi:hypothetical protein